MDEYKFTSISHYVFMVMEVEATVTRFHYTPSPQDIVRPQKIFYE